MWVNSSWSGRRSGLQQHAPDLMRPSFGDLYIRPPSLTILRTYTNIMLHQNPSVRLIRSGGLLHKQPRTSEQWFAVKPLYPIVESRLPAAARSVLLNQFAQYLRWSSCLKFNMSFLFAFTVNTALATLQASEHSMLVLS